MYKCTTYHAKIFEFGSLKLINVNKKAAREKMISQHLMGINTVAEEMVLVVSFGSETRQMAVAVVEKLKLC